MQPSSQAIGTIAAALAKAQAQLVNPEKSLVATIRSDGRRGTEQTFRYAPLSSGLDIVRKTLSQHEIAIVQTTSIDETAGIVRLSTVLAHASGEWIASDWPVCAISDTATPHRMGAALTYARRYALFTLVGIAGEDDLDAPDLTPSAQSAASTGRTEPRSLDRPTRENGRKTPSIAAPILPPKVSAELRDSLVGQIHKLNGADQAALWAHRSLVEKNKLTTADAQIVEQAFQLKLATVEMQSPSGDENSKSLTADTRIAQERRSQIDKSTLLFPEPRRIRDRDHIRHVIKQPCLICGRRPSDPHHLRFAQNGALGRKVSDEFTVPLCRGHHRELHRCGDEAGWWSKAGIEPTVTARKLRLETHPLLRPSDDRRDTGRPSLTSAGSVSLSGIEAQAE
jgi:hypothetical protein